MNVNNKGKKPAPSKAFRNKSYVKKKPSSNRSSYTWQSFLRELASQVDLRWRDVVLKVNASPDIFGRPGGTMFRFESQYVRGVLGEYVLNPKKVTRAKVAALAKELNRTFNLAEALRFFKYNFLKKDSNKNPFEAKLREYALLYLKNYTDLMQTDRFDDAFFSFIKEGRMLAALMHLLEDKPGFVFLATSKWETLNQLKGKSNRSFALGYLMDSTGSITPKDELAMANAVYERELKKIKDRSPNLRDTTIYNEAYTAARKTLCTLQARLKEYHKFLFKRYKEHGHGHAIPERVDWAQADIAKHAYHCMSMLLRKQYDRIGDQQDDDFWRWAESPSSSFVFD